MFSTTTIRVVNDASDRDRERRQGEDIERVFAELQTDHGDQQRQRNRDRGDQGRPNREQEEQDHQYREGQTEQSLDRKIMDRLFDQWRLVEDGGDCGVVAQLLLEARNLVADLVRDRHRIGVGVLENGKAKSRPAVGPSDGGRTRSTPPSRQRPQRAEQDPSGSALAGLETA
jgi:hypothetical protein